MELVHYLLGAFEEGESLYPHAQGKFAYILQSKLVKLLPIKTDLSNSEKLGNSPVMERTLLLRVWLLMQGIMMHCILRCNSFSLKEEDLV